MKKYSSCVIHLFVYCSSYYLLDTLFCFTAAVFFLKRCFYYIYTSTFNILLSATKAMLVLFSDLLFSDIKNGYTSRFLGFSVYVSNTTVTTDGKLCFKDTSFNRTTVPAILNITCIVHGQYVIYYNERLTNGGYPTYYSRYAHNELCEVEVYGKSFFSILLLVTTWLKCLIMISVQEFQIQIL